MAGTRKRHSGQTKLKAVLELLQGKRTIAQIARAYRVHPNSITGWKQTEFHSSLENPVGLVRKPKGLPNPYL